MPVTRAINGNVIVRSTHQPGLSTSAAPATYPSGRTVLYCHFNEPPGVIPLNLTGCYGLNLASYPQLGESFVLSTSWPGQYSNGCLYGPGIGGRHLVAPHSSLNNVDGLTDFSIEVWVKMAISSGVYTLVASGHPTPTDFDGFINWALRINANRVQLLWGNSAVATPAYSLLSPTVDFKQSFFPFDAIWKHIKASFTGNTAKIYVNGVLIASAVVDNAIQPRLSSASDLVFVAGDSANRYTLLGYMDELRVTIGNSRPETDGVMPSTEYDDIADNTYSVGTQIDVNVGVAAQMIKFRIYHFTGSCKATLTLESNTEFVAAPIPADPYYDQVVLLCPFDRIGELVSLQPAQALLPGVPFDGYAGIGVLSPGRLGDTTKGALTGWGGQLAIPGSSSHHVYNTTDFCIEVWFLNDGTINEATIVQSGSAYGMPSRFNWGVRIDGNNRVNFFWGDSSYLPGNQASAQPINYIISNAIATDDAWHFLKVAITGQTAKILLDGVLLVSQVLTTTTQERSGYSADVIRIGPSNYGGLVGRIADLRVTIGSSRAESDGLVQNAPYGGPPPIRTLVGDVSAKIRAMASEYPMQPLIGQIDALISPAARLGCSYPLNPRFDNYARYVILRCNFDDPLQPDRLGDASGHQTLSIINGANIGTGGSGFLSLGSTGYLQGLPNPINAVNGLTDFCIECVAQTSTAQFGVFTDVIYGAGRLVGCGTGFSGLNWALSITADKRILLEWGNGVSRYTLQTSILELATITFIKAAFTADRAKILVNGVLQVSRVVDNNKQPRLGTATDTIRIGASHSGGQVYNLGIYSLRVTVGHSRYLDDGVGYAFQVPFFLPPHPHITGQITTGIYPISLDGFYYALVGQVDMLIQTQSSYLTSSAYSETGFILTRSYPASNMIKLSPAPSGWLYRRYQISMGGAPVLILPINAFMLSLTVDGASELSIDISGNAGLIDAIADRQLNGITVSVVQVYGSRADWLRDVAHFDYNGVGMSQNKSGQVTFTLRGLKTVSATASKTVLLSSALSSETNDGQRRYRCALNFDLALGDTALIHQDSFRVGKISYVVSPRDEYMDIVEYSPDPLDSGFAIGKNARADELLAYTISNEHLHYPLWMLDAFYYAGVFASQKAIGQPITLYHDPGGYLWFLPGLVGQNNVPVLLDDLITQAMIDV